MEVVTVVVLTAMVVVVVAVTMVVVQAASPILNVKCITSMGTLLLFVIFSLMKTISQIPL